MDLEVGLADGDSIGVQAEMTPRKMTSLAGMPAIEMVYSWASQPAFQSRRSWVGDR